MRAGTDFRPISVQLLEDLFNGVLNEAERKKFFAVGNNKVLFMNEVLSVLERARDKISEKKSSGANLLKHAFRLYKARGDFRASIFQVFKFQRWWRMRKILLA